MTEIVFLAFSRTPIGAFQGALADAPATQLGSVAIRAVLSRSGADATLISDVFMGNVLQAGLGQAPARQAALRAGLPASVRCVTVNKVCGSGLEAIVAAARALAVGEASVAIAGGMESMSNAPYLLPKSRMGYRLGHQQVIDALVHDGLWDPHGDKHMGDHAEMCAGCYALSREKQDAYAIASFQRANDAQQKALFEPETVPVEISDAKGNVSRVKLDEGPAKVRYEKIPLLKPVFQKNGTITPANASSINDGAAALLLTTSDRAQRIGLKPLARLVSARSHSHEPAWFTTAPVQAARNALQAAGWSINDVDLWEVNEAFAVVPLAFMQELGISHEKLNVNGGAISLGHPLGASGARILVTLLAALQSRGLKRGVAAICIGGGEGMAACIELL